ncbi:MAG TPA: AEC family transporter [Campylobacterales bacterium]|nr:AEC family transporter [Campylobacterales bacterium]
MSLLLSIIGVYFFVSLGFAAKRIFGEIDERTLVLLSVYFLQPILSFWGILGAKIDFAAISAPLIYFGISLFAAVFGFFVFSRVFEDKKDAVIVTAGGVIGNTGNLGIPLLLAMFGKTAVFYAVLINIANIFVLYVVGVFLYSLGSYTAKEAIKNILSMPVVWSTLAALLMNHFGLTVPDSFEQTIEMGAYTSMTLQLIIFGVFLGGLGRFRPDFRLMLWGMGYKFLAVPLFAFTVLSFLDIDLFIKSLIFLQVCMPLAVNNVNLASLYGCKPYAVTANILASAVLFIGLIFVYKSVF